MTAGTGRDVSAGLVADNASTAAPTVNVARRLARFAALQGDVVAVAAPRGRNPAGRQDYDQITFRGLEADSNRIASGLLRLGVTPGTRLALLVRPGVDFVSLVFGLLKSGAVAILIDPGMGRRNLVKCLEAAEPEGFVAIPAAQAVRRLLAHRFPKARFNVTVGRGLFSRGPTLAALRASGRPDFEPAATRAEDPAAIIFTTGSTGPPKGVLYQHGNFDAQVEQLGAAFGIAAGEVDLAGFPLFGLFNGAMGVTTVVPVMDPTRPAKVVPEKLLSAIRDWRVTQSFGSPAIWNRVGLECERTGEPIVSLRRVISAGAPVPAHVLARMKSCLPDGAEIHTPYGATEALPVASITASEILDETQVQTRLGAGVCVGRRFSGIRWQVIPITEGPIAQLTDVEPVASGQIGELIVTGPVVTREYVTRREWNALAKIVDGPDIWHRMGDAGYLDDRERFWFCGRVAHRVMSTEGPMFSSPCEEIFNCHPAVYRSALVGIGPTGRQQPVIVVECWPGKQPRRPSARRVMVAELRGLAQANPLTRQIHDFLFIRSMPVDIRHNAKIFREKLAVFAEASLGLGGSFEPSHWHSG